MTVEELIEELQKQPGWMVVTIGASGRDIERVRPWLGEVRLEAVRG